MSWREAFLTRCGVGYFGGISLGLWLRVLHENRFSVDLPYWGRAAAITLGSLANTALARLETAVYGKRIRSTRVEPPLFILGIWRSGTTLLHNLLARDDRFAFANNYQVCFPNTFLTTERRNARLAGFFLPKKRPQDNVAMGVQEPQEDEFAFCSMTGRSYPMGLVFPRRAEHYERYLTLRNASTSEIEQWQSAFLGLVQKLSFKHRRPLLLKSPGHTCRINLLLKIFPGARFVHIHRNPYTVFQSLQHLIRTVMPWFALQRPTRHDLEEWVIQMYRQVYDVFFEERGMIPQGQLHEVRFEELEADPLGQVRRVYDALALPSFQTAEPMIRRYAESLSDYRKNAFPELSGRLRTRIAQEWRRSFDEWGYPR